MQQHLKRVVIFFIVGALLSGCGSSKLKYVVYRDVPEHPSFVVVPVNFSVADYKFKENTESSLIEMGLSVIEPPLMKQPDMTVNEELLRAKRNMKSDDYLKKSSVNELIETSKIYNQSNADYIVLVNAETNVLKITKRQTHEIQAVIEYTVLDKSGSRFIKLHDALLSLGFKIKTVAREEKLKMEYPLKEKSLMRY